MSHTKVFLLDDILRQGLQELCGGDSQSNAVVDFDRLPSELASWLIRRVAQGGSGRTFVFLNDGTGTSVTPLPADSECPREGLVMKVLEGQDFLNVAMSANPDDES